MTYLFKPDVPFDGEVKNDIGNPLPISKNTTVNSDANPIIVKGTSDSSFFAPTQSDAFGRLRTSNPFTLFDSFHRFQDNGKVNEFTSGTASSTHNSNAGCIEMTIGSSLGDKIYRESSKVFAYQPGKSLLILQTFCMSPGKAGLRQRQGYFDTESGFYVELDGTTLSLVRRNSVTGIVQETRVNQKDWNVDNLGHPQGTKNPSGVTLDPTKTQIMFTDIEWLGVGSARMGFVIDGQFVLCHVFHHANKPSTPESDTTLPYMKTACLPVRAEFENTAATTGPSTYKIICTSVISEGGYELRGRPISVGHSISSPYSLQSSATLYPIMSIRLKSTRLQSIVLPKNFSIGVGSAANYRWALVRGGTTTGGTWVSAGTDSSVEYNLTGTSISGGLQIETGYVIASNQAAVSPSMAQFPFENQLQRNTFTNSATEFTVCIVTDTSNKPNVWASINWEEVT